VGAALFLRVCCLDYSSLDYQDFLSDWYSFFKTNGGFAAFDAQVGNYNMPYLYFMAAASYLDVPDLYLIKLFSILFDILLAWGGFRLVRILRKEEAGAFAPLAAFVLLLFLPTVVLNGALWGQCDGIYGAFVLHAMASLLEGRNKTSVILLGLAFSFKLQAIFIVPLWGVMWLAKRVRFRELLLFPLTFGAALVPALLLGKPLKDALSVYLGQMGVNVSLTFNAPSVFQFIPWGATANQELLAGLGILAAALLVCILLGLGWWLRKALSHRTVLMMAVVLAVGVPFLLPYMHERYFFLADILTLCLACCLVRTLPIAILTGLSSLGSYLVYLTLRYNKIVYIGESVFVMGLEALLMLAALVMGIGFLIWEVQMWHTRTCTEKRKES